MDADWTTSDGCSVGAFVLHEVREDIQNLEARVRAIEHVMSTSSSARSSAKKVKTQRLVSDGCGKPHNNNPDPERQTPIYDLYNACSDGCLRCVTRI